MGQITYRGNLSSKTFPFISENFGRTIIVPQYDNTYVRNIQDPQDPDKDVGVPQLYYCHNVMPHSAGLQSVGYTQLIAPVSGVTDFSSIYTLRDSANNKAYLGIKANGDLYVCDGVGGPWTFKQTGTAGALVTIAYVSGVTYIYVAGVGCYKYDFVAAAFVSVTLSGLVAANVIGICPSFGYLVAWTSNYVSWSSTLDPTDFNPSLTTGAGGGAVESARGAINYCIPHNLGFVVGTANNCVVALYQNNTNYPFTFREIVNSGGMTSLELVDTDPNSSSLYSYTTSGMQLISSTQTQTVFPEITDFISGRYFEDFDDPTKTFTSTALSTALKKKLSIIADRYLVISYGIYELTHALVYDFAQKRYGKLKITHVDCFEYQIPTAGILEAPRQSFAFLQKDGTVQSVDFSIASPTSNGTVILGKYQFTRPRLLQLDKVVLESTRQTQNFSLTVLPALDGKNWVTSVPTLTYSNGLTREYQMRDVGQTISLLGQGGFVLETVLLTFNIDAKR